MMGWVISKLWGYSADTYGTVGGGVISILTNDQ